MPKKSRLTEKQESFTEAILDGKNVREAARTAGYKDETAGYNTMRVAEVQQKLREARSELADATMIKRVDIIEGILDAVQIAKLGADAGAMIRGYAEVAKMLGYYEPEKKIVELTANQGRLRQKFETMTDDELLLLIESPENTPINGEFSHVN